MGLVAATATLAAFGGLSWWVSTEGSVVGYIAAALFGIMAVLGAIIVYILIVFDDKTPSVRVDAGKNGSDGDLDPGMVAAAMLVGTSEQFHDNESVDASDDYSDDMADFD